MNWTREETIVAFWAYSRIPFKESSARHPEVVRIAKILGRTPAAVNMKIGNIGRLDPSLAEQGITGLTHGANLEKDIWKAFAQDPETLAMESLRIISKRSGKTIEEMVKIDLEDLPQGREREKTMKQRIGQSFFRTAVLTSYNNRCCISGIAEPKLLEACHILDWSANEKLRTDPRNGLCMNPFFHRAYDKWLIGISPDFHLYISERLIEGTVEDEARIYLSKLQGKTIALPDRFKPNRDLLSEHYNVFAKLNAMDTYVTNCDKEPHRTCGLNHCCRSF